MWHWVCHFLNYWNTDEIMRHTQFSSNYALTEPHTHQFRLILIILPRMWCVLKFTYLFSVYEICEQACLNYFFLALIQMLNCCITKQKITDNTGGSGDILFYLQKTPGVEQPSQQKWKILSLSRQKRNKLLCLSSAFLLSILKSSNGDVSHSCYRPSLKPSKLHTVELKNISKYYHLPQLIQAVYYFTCCGV